jgi:peroxiredoxin
MPKHRRTEYVSIGDPMPELTLARLGGGEFRFSSLRGRFALLYLWASW